MVRKRRKTVSTRRTINVKESNDDDRPAQDNNGDEKSAKDKAKTVDHRSPEEKSAMDSFYEKLTKLNESSGLSSVFNFRETKLDLFLFYKEVTERGGSQQVSKAGKWKEVASALSIKNHDSILPSQIQKVYENLLCQYELIHNYRTPAKTSGKGQLECSVGKIKAFDTSSEDDEEEEEEEEGEEEEKEEEERKCTVHTFQESRGKGRLECPVGKRKSLDCSSEGDEEGKRRCTVHTFQVSRGPGRPRKQPSLQTSLDPVQARTPSLDEKIIIRDPFAPVNARTPYQMFLKMECERLRTMHGGKSGSLNLRDMAVEAWRHLAKNDRQPYVDASRKDKERFDQETAVYKQRLGKKVTMTEGVLSGSTSTYINFGASSPINDDYHVNLEVDDTGNSDLPDESLVQSTIQILKNAQPNDPIFQMNWDGCSDCTDSPSS